MFRPRLTMKKWPYPRMALARISVASSSSSRQTMMSLSVWSIVCSRASRWWTLSALSSTVTYTSALNALTWSKSNALNSPWCQRNVAWVLTIT